MRVAQLLNHPLLAQLLNHLLLAQLCVAQLFSVEKSLKTTLQKHRRDRLIHNQVQTGQKNDVNRQTSAGFLFLKTE
jgi:hypothetical protein